MVSGTATPDASLEGAATGKGHLAREALRFIVRLADPVPCRAWPAQLLAAKGPAEHLSLISFAIWSSIVHGLIMAVQSVASREHIGHLYGDVLALFLVAGVLAYLCPTAARIGIKRAVA